MGSSLGFPLRVSCVVCPWFFGSLHVPVAPSAYREFTIWIVLGIHRNTIASYSISPVPVISDPHSIATDLFFLPRWVGCRTNFVH